MRHGDAHACTVPFEIKGFRGWRYRFWNYEEEIPFQEWQDPEACIGWMRQPKPQKVPRRKLVTRNRDAWDAYYNEYHDNYFEPLF